MPGPWDGNVHGPFTRASWRGRTAVKRIDGRARGADPRLVTGTFTTAVQVHTALEPHACVAPLGRPAASLHLHLSTQSVGLVRRAGRQAVEPARGSGSRRRRSRRRRLRGQGRDHRRDDRGRRARHEPAARRSAWCSAGRGADRRRQPARDPDHARTARRRQGRPRGPHHGRPRPRRGVHRVGRRGVSPVSCTARRPGGSATST